jgi:hypothetical protein
MQVDGGTQLAISIAMIGLVVFNGEHGTGNDQAAEHMIAHGDLTRKSLWISRL